MPKRPRPPIISSSLAASGTVGTAFTYQIAATNNPTSFSAVGLPVGLTVNSTSGLISGQPAVGADLTSPYGAVISARNAGGTGRGTLNVTIKPAPVAPPVVTQTATVSWTQIATATGYKIFWGRQSKSYAYSQDVGNALQCVVSDLTKGSAYYFSGKSYNATQTSDYGNEVRFVP